MYIALYNLAQAALASGDLDLAQSHLAEGIELSGLTRDAANLPYFFEALAVVESRRGRPGRVATLTGSASAMRALAGAAVYSYYRPDESMTRAAAEEARQTLGGAAFDTAVQGGRTLELVHAVAYAVGTGSRA